MTTRIHTCTLLSLLLVFAAQPVVADIPPSGDGAIVVANRGGASISVIDVATSDVNTVAMPAGDNTPEPMYVVYSPMNDLVFVGDRANDRVVAFDAQTFAVETTIPTGAGVFHMWGEPSTGQLWVNNDIDNTVSVLDMTGLSNLDTFSTPADLVALGGKPHDVILDPSGPYGYVSMIGVDGANDYVVKYDASTYNEMDRQAVGNDPHLSLSAFHDKLYVPSQGGDMVSVLDRDTLNPLTTIGVDNAHGATTSKDGSLFFTTDIADGGVDAVVVIDTSTDTVIGSADSLLAVPHNLSLSPDENLIYVTHSGEASDQVSIFDVSNPMDPTYLTSVTVGLNPFGLTTIPEPMTLLIFTAGALILLRNRR